MASGWSKGEQALFETSLACLTASAGFPLQWVENQEWLAFCERWIPSAKTLSHKVLTQRLIPATLSEFKGAAKHQAHGLEGTASCNGWTGSNFHHFIVFMVNCNSQVSCVSVETIFDTESRIDTHCLSL